MKNPFTIVPLLSLSIASPCLAEQAANPFVKMPEASKPVAVSGASFVSLLEHVLVPPTLLDDWLRIHPLMDDATELRTAVQAWVIEGKAKLDHTALSVGTAGNPSGNDSILEQIYPTEFEAGEAGTWPRPAAFDTRTIGYTLESGASTTDGNPALWAGIEVVERLGSKAWDPLAERTREADDVFIPTFRSSRLGQSTPSKPEEPQASNDPFAEPQATPEASQKIVFQPGAVRLAGRLDSSAPGNLSERLSRLIFAKGAIADGTEKASAPAKPPEISHVSFRIVRAPHLAFSTWIQDHDLLAVSADAWKAADGWQRDGKAEILDELTASIREGIESTLENVVEVTYPTEWEPVERTAPGDPAQDGKLPEANGHESPEKRPQPASSSGFLNASRPTAFETRNAGTEVRATFSIAESGVTLQYKLERLSHAGDSVHRRIEVDGKWIPDVTMPLFAVNRMQSPTRILPGQWMLVATGSEYLPTGKVDAKHCLLVFVKAE